MIPVRILGTGSFLPGREVTTAEVVKACLPHKDPATMEAKIGIQTRYWAPPGARMAEVAAGALGRAIESAGLAPTDLRRVIFVSSTGGDFTNPATASSVIDALGCNGACDGFDVANACVGFVTGMDLAARSVATGISPVGVVAVELFSRFIRPEEPRPYLVLGDGAGAVVLGEARPDEGICGVSLGNNGAHGGTAYIDHPSLTGKAEYSVFAMKNDAMNSIATAAIVDSAAAVLKQRGLSINDIEWVLPHQPNGQMFDGILKALGVPKERTMPVVHDIGSVSAASIPISLDRLLRSGRVRAGDRILMVAVGSGLAYGALLYQVGPSVGA